MWTRLLYLNLNKAFKPVKVKNKWHKPLLSGRYRGMLKQQFRMFGLNPPFKKKIDPSQFMRNKMPKGHKHELNKPQIRLDKIKEGLLNQEENILEYRQKSINDRRYSGFDRMVKELIPEWYGKTKKK